MKFPAFDPSSPQTLKVMHLLAIPMCKCCSTIKTYVRIWLRVKQVMATLKKNPARTFWDRGRVIGACKTWPLRRPIEGNGLQSEDWEGLWQYRGCTEQKQGLQASVNTDHLSQAAFSACWYSFTHAFSEQASNVKKQKFDQKNLQALLQHKYKTMIFRLE